MTNDFARGFGLSLFALMAMLLLGAFSNLAAQEPRPPLLVPIPAEPALAPLEPAVEIEEDAGVPPVAPNLSELVRFVVLESLKEGFIEDKHWNKNSERFDGFRVRGLRISKRKKEVRHGFCRRYEANLIAPEENFQLDIEQTTLPKNDNTAFVLRAKLQARCKATFAHYLYGIKGANGTTVADADISLRLVLTVDPRTKFSFSDPLPRFNLNAHVRSVDLQVKDIDLRRIGIIDGGFAELLGEGSEVAIEQLIQNQESRIKQKLQRELDKIQGK